MRASKKIYRDSNKLLEILDSSKKMVFTNGCFDILHIGHLDILEKARALGDYLVVGINSDDSIRQLKAEDRPIFPLEYRMKMLASLEQVDFIIPFEEQTPLQLIVDLKPMVLVKGGDYHKKEIVGYTETLAIGGKVETIKFVHPISTSQIISKIRSIKNENS